MYTNEKMLLNFAQQKAVAIHYGPVLIIAGAGSGKTRVITYRIASLLEAGIPENQILAVTFTNKAATEMRQRVKGLYSKKLKDLTITTFHSFGLKILREYHKLLNYKSNFTVFDETDKEGLIRELITELKIDTQLSPSTIGAYFSLIKNERADWSGSFAKYEILFNEYNSSLHLYQAFDFDDLITVPLKLLKNNPEVLLECQDRYRFIMIDEFQDTSALQYNFINLLAQKYRNICVVGDDDQSIYSFRGAYFANLLRFEKDFPELQEIKLEENYRSTATILTAANSVIAHNTQRKPKALYTKQYQGELITLIFPESEREEGNFIVELIRENLIKRKLNYNQIGILLRTNHLTRSIEEALLSVRLPYKISGGNSFFSRREVKDILAYLTVIVNPDNELSLLRIINTPRRGIGKAILIDLLNYARAHQLSLFKTIQLASSYEISNFKHYKASEALRDFLLILEKTKEKMQDGMANALRELIGQIDYLAYLRHQYKNEKIVRYKYNSLESLINSLADYESDPEINEKSLRDYLLRINLLLLDDNQADEKQDKINLVTVHAAKGLEYEVVFIAGAEDGIFPHERSLKEQQDNLEEERRLFYVALTRARAKLYISACKTRRRIGEVQVSSPSPFIYEIPKELCEVYQPNYLDSQQVQSMFKSLKERYKV